MVSGPLLDALDVFIDTADRTVQAIAEARLLAGSSNWRDPSTSREVCTFALTKDSVLTITEMSRMMRSGIVRPISLSIRRLHEIQVDANFIRLDKTGEVSLRWRCWQIYDRSRLEPDNEKVQADKEALLRDTPYNEYEMKNRTHWAVLPNGKKYYRLDNRTDYVRGKLKTEWPLSEFSQEDRARMIEATDLELKRANALIHPTLIGNAYIRPPDLLVNMATLSTMHTLLALDKVAVEEQPPLSAQDELKVSEGWKRTTDAFKNLAANIAEIGD